MQQRWAGVTAAFAGLFCTVACAMGLGEIQVTSHLNQPLAASIPLTSLSVGEAENLQVQLASPADFDKAGVVRSDYLSSLRFEVSGSRVRISSSEIAREPVVALLIEARSGNSRVLRGYTVLLDSPGAADGASSSVAGAPVADAALAPAPAAVQAPAAAGVANTAAQQTYGPVRSGQTFWSIATQLRPDPKQVSMDQTLLALYAANPQAFLGGFDGLLIGAVLRVPSIAEMRAVPEPEARRRVRALRAGGSAIARPAAAAAAAPAPAATPDTTATANVAPETVPPPAPVLAETPLPAASTPVSPTPVPAQAEVSSGSEPAPPAAVTEAAAAAAVEPPAMPSDAVAETPGGVGPGGEMPVAAEAPAAAAPAPAESGATAEPPTSPPQAAAESTPAATDPLIWVWAGLALALLLLLLLWLLARRRRPVADPRRAAPPTLAPAAAPAVAAAEPGPATANLAAAEPSPIASEADTRADELALAMAAEAAIVDQEPQPQDVDLAPAAADAGPAPDPLAEADFHLSYGLYDEAARSLLEAIAAEPERNDLQLKLAETYFAARRADEFESLALRAQPRLGPSEWGRLQFMGAQLCPDSPLFRAESDDEARSAHQQNLVDFALQPIAEPPPPEPLPEIGNRLDFELDAPPAPSLPPSSQTQRQIQGIWRMPEPGVPGDAALDLSRPRLIPIDELLGDTDIDLYEAEPEVEISTDDEVGTKLDLARAYLDMGDDTMARDLLAEVAVQGTPAQKVDAQALLQRLPL